ncbi:hypothetical protein HC928_16275 [bacterium]|nr:hypothetical protein [bacterium]
MTRPVAAATLDAPCCCNGCVPGKGWMTEAGMTTINTPDGEAVFLLDPRHDAYVVGDSAHLGDLRLNWPQRLVLLGLVAFSVLLFAGDLLATTVQAQATILEKSEGADLMSYFVVYSFIAEVPTGRERVTVEEEIVFELFRQIEPGDQVTIQYQPGDLESARIIERAPDAINANNLRLFVVALLLSLGLYMLIFWLIRPGRLNRRLESEGVLLPGRITNIYPRKALRAYIVNVAFAFEEPGTGGAEARRVTAEAKRNRRDLESTLLPRPGTAVRVLYVDSSTFRLM